MVTALVIGGLFLGGVGLYSYLLKQQSVEEQNQHSSAHQQLNGLVGVLHSMNDQLKARMAQKPATFDDAMAEAIKDNRN